MLNSARNSFEIILLFSELDIRIGGKWMKMGTFDIPHTELEKIYDGYKFINGYNDYFIKTLNTGMNDVPCVFTSNGPYKRKHSLWTLRYECRHGQCERINKVFQISKTHYMVVRNFKEITHEEGNPICRPVKANKREEAKKKLSKMFADKYLAECEDGADTTLYQKGNLQDMILIDAAKQIRCEAIYEQDFHKDEIIDLLLMKLSEEDND